MNIFGFFYTNWNFLFLFDNIEFLIIYRKMKGGDNLDKFKFLEESPFFIDKFEQTNDVFFYYEKKDFFHARIFVPKNDSRDFKWHYYEKTENKPFYYRTENIPNWFEELVDQASEIVFFRDRLRRLVKGKSNDFYKKNKKD